VTSGVFWEFETRVMWLEKSLLIAWRSARTLSRQIVQLDCAPLP
jgi:hypothetical protein